MATVTDHDLTRSADLQPVILEDHWDRATQGGEDPLLPLLLRARQRSSDLTDRAVERIVASIPAYADRTVVSRDDLWLSVSRNLEANLLVLAERRHLSDDELMARAALGARRAAAGVSISDLLRAFRVGYLVLWEGLTEVARDLGPETVNQLLDDAGRIWECLDRISSAVATTYRESMERRDVDARRRALAIVAGLEAYPDEQGATATAVRDLGLDPAGLFVVAVCSGHGLNVSDGRVVVAEQPGRSVILYQPGSGARHADTQLQTRLVEAGATAVGLGTVAHGLTGAKRSLCEAVQAHTCAEATGADSLSWRDDWFTCLVVDSACSLEPLVTDVLAAFEDCPETVETLAAFVAENGNTTAAARRLHLHANSVTYRLQRLRETSGLDVKSDVGLLTAQLALALEARSD